jgi:hypothetical protein
MRYAGTIESPYRRIFGSRLDPEILVYWTGPEVVSIGITREALDLAVHRFREHELLIWDNYPVNDFACARPSLVARRRRADGDRIAGTVRVTGVVVYRATAAGVAAAVAAHEAGAKTLLVEPGRESDLLDGSMQDDVVALGSYNIDIHEVERMWRYLPEYVRAAGVFNEGYLSVAVPPYAIPYRSLTPRREDAEDLLVPVCISASHVAFGSVRMEPTLMLLGHAAGLAAAQAARRSVAVQDVDIEELQRSLLDQGQVLSL